MIIIIILLKLNIFSQGIEYIKRFIPLGTGQENNIEPGYKIQYGPPFKLFRLIDPVVELTIILIKKYGDWNNIVTKNHLQRPKEMILPQTVLKIRSDISKSFVQFNISHVILKSFVCNLNVICMSIVCTLMPLKCHSYVTVMYSYVIRMSLL